VNVRILKKNLPHSFPSHPVILVILVHPSHAGTVFHLTHSPSQIGDIGKSMLREYVTRAWASVTVGAVDNNFFVFIRVQRGNLFF